MDLLLSRLVVRLDLAEVALRCCLPPSRPPALQLSSRYLSPMASCGVVCRHETSPGEKLKKEEKKKEKKKEKRSDVAGGYKNKAR